MTANEARAKAQELKEAKARELKERAEKLCECYDNDINNAIALGQNSITVRGIALELVDDVIAILKENDYAVHPLAWKNDIMVSW